MVIDIHLVLHGNTRMHILLTQFLKKKHHLHEVTICAFHSHAAQHHFNAKSYVPSQASGAEFNISVIVPLIDDRSLNIWFTNPTRLCQR